MIISGPPPNAVVGAPYLHTVTATGFPTPTFQISPPVSAQSSLNAVGFPPGLTFDQNTGTISGTPTTAGNYSFVVTATNTVGQATATYTITIDPDPAATTTPPPNPTVPTVGQLPATGTNWPTTTTITGAILIALGGLLLRLRRTRARPG